MRKKASKRKNKIMLILAIILVIAILISFYGFLTYFLHLPSNLTTAYKMELYAKTPSDFVVKVNECQSSSKDFYCSFNFKDCSENGQYYGRALTITGNTILSDSGWQPMYKC